MEGPEDRRHESRLERPVRDNREVKTWMAGTSPAMTNLNTAPVASPCSPQRLQFARQRVGPLRDVAGAEADHKIAAAGEAVHHMSEVGGFLQRNHLAMAVRAQAQHKMIAVDPGNRRFTGRINLRDDNRIGVIETGTKF